VRARKAAVLNADNDYSLGMMTTTPAEQLGLVSLELPVETLVGMLDRPGLVCAIEIHDGESWLVVSGNGESHSLIRLNDIPATFEGKAAHNIANAMQAVLAARFLGAPNEIIRKALAGFQSDFATSEGRLNFMPGLPYQFLLDYAHNLDGFRVLTHFTSQLDIAGRRILLLAYTGDRGNHSVQEAVTFIAPFFDLFICTNYRTLRGRDPQELPGLISACLLEAGAESKQVIVEPDRDLAMKAATGAAQAGDLLVFLSSTNEFRTIWESMENLRDQLSPGD
jgi:cyanophycin synthetase